MEKSPGVGSRFIVEGFPAIGTGGGSLILEEVQPAGKKVMSGKAFLAGARDW
jgi:methionyl-tRNA formyltransferase